tara:strand:- start:294 stop:1007 length:714 start_codon:yes stop_codon:yes gene_type:complete
MALKRKMQKNRAEKRKQMQAKPASTTASTTAKKKTGMSDFGKAFATARRKFLADTGPATFTFKGKKFNVQTADDRKKTIGLEKAREEGLTGGRPFEAMGLKEARKAGLVGDQGRAKGRGRQVKGKRNLIQDIKNLFKSDPELKKMMGGGMAGTTKKMRGGGMMKKMRGGGMIEKKMGGGMMGTTKKVAGKRGGGMMGATKKVGMKKGGQVKTTKKVAMKKSSIDGIARKGKTRGRMV